MKGLDTGFKFEENVLTQNIACRFTLQMLPEALCFTQYSASEVHSYPLVSSLMLI